VSERLRTEHVEVKSMAGRAHRTPATERV